MRHPKISRTVAFLAGAALVVAAGSTDARVQKLSPADVAARLSGSWKVNLELSPSLGGAGRRGRGGQPRRPALMATGLVLQRGGGRGGDAGGPSDLTPEERAAQAAMRQLQQVAPTITITATADSVTFADSRGERTFKIDGKKINIDVAGARVSVGTKWDKTTLRQDYEVPESRLIQIWEVDGNDRLVLKARVESRTLMSAEARTVYDRQ